MENMIYEYTSSDGQRYTWNSSNECILNLTAEEKNELQNEVSKKHSKEIDGEVNSIKSGIVINTSNKKLSNAFNIIERIVKRDFKVTYSSHAAFRSAQRNILDSDIEYICNNPLALEEARLTVKSSHKGKQILLKQLNDEISFKIKGVTEQGVTIILALAYIVANRIHIITVFDE